MSNITLENKIEQILDSLKFLKKDEQGFYKGEIYIDSEDMYISDKDVLAKLSEGGIDEVQYFINEHLEYYNINEYSYLDKLMKEHFSEADYELYEDEIHDFINDKVYFVTPNDFIWGSEVLVDLIITAYDDWNVEFTENTLFEDDDNRTKIGYGGLRWLIEQQGFSVEDFENVLNTKDATFSNKFYDTVYEELINATTSLNALVVSVKMTLRELVTIKQDYDKNTLKSFKINKNCDIGLVDFWQGAGSLLNISLDKDLEIPYENIYMICCDSFFNYGISNIYGHDSSSYWTDVDYKYEVATV